MSSFTACVVVLLACTFLCLKGEASRILLVPTAQDNSHIYTLRKVQEELTVRGHDATVIPYTSTGTSQLYFLFPGLFDVHPTPTVMMAINGLHHSVVLAVRHPGLGRPQAERA